MDFVHMLTLLSYGLCLRLSDITLELENIIYNLI